MKRGNKRCYRFLMRCLLLLGAFFLCDASISLASGPKDSEGFPKEVDSDTNPDGNPDDNASVYDSGVSIVDTNCRPNVSHELAISCKAKGITLEEYRVTVHFKPTDKFRQEVAGWLSGLGVFTAGVGFGLAIFVEIVMNDMDQLFTLPVNDVKYSVPELEGIVTMWAEPVGSHACVYMDILGFIFPTYVPKDPEYVAIAGREPGMQRLGAGGKALGPDHMRDKGLYRHCVKMPPPKDLPAPLDWGPYISKACVGMCQGYDHDGDVRTPYSNACYDHDNDGYIGPSHEDVVKEVITALKDKFPSQADNPSRFERFPGQAYLPQDNPNISYDGAIEDASDRVVESTRTYYNYIRRARAVEGEDVENADLKDTIIKFLKADLVGHVDDVSTLDDHANDSYDNFIALEPDYDAAIVQAKISFAIRNLGRTGTLPQSIIAAQSKYPMTAQMMQCIQGTVENILFRAAGADVTGGEADDWDGSFFAQVQQGFRYFVTALLVLYVVIFGYKMLLEGKLKRDDVIWRIIFIGVVLFFISGPGVRMLSEELPKISQEVGYIFIDPVRSDDPDEVVLASTAGEAINEAQIAVEAARRDVIAARRNFRRQAVHSGLVTPDAIAANQEEYDDFIAELEEFESVYNSRMKALGVLENQYSNVKYDICDFHNVSYEMDAIEDADGVQIQRARDWSALRVWDAIDCRVANFLGLGQSAMNPNSPMLLVIASTALGNNEGFRGLVIVLFVLVFAIFMLMLVVRLVSIYVVAFMAIMLLLYFSPLFISAILFEQTKDVTKKWIKQLISYTVQPMILFAFLSFFFFVSETIFYGDNVVLDGKVQLYEKVEGQAPERCDEVKIAEKATDSSEDKVECVCEDPETLGCIFHDAVEQINSSDYDESGQIEVTQSWSEVDLDTVQLGVMVRDSFYLFVLCYLFYGLMSQVETLSKTLTNAAAGGAASMGANTVRSPHKIAQSIVGRANQATNLVGKTLSKAVPARAIGALSSNRKAASKRVKVSDDSISKGGKS